MPRKVVVLVSAIAVVVVAFLIVRYLWFRDTSTPVSVEEAVREAGPTGPNGPVNGVPAPPSGVYLYDTAGGERVEALLSTEHRYPATTTITLRRGGCGLIARWAPLEERQSEWDLCPGRRGWELRSIYETHQFFGQHDERRYLCPGGVLFRPRGTWRYVCRFEQTTDDYRGRFVGRETLRVAGRPVETIHVRDSDLLSGRETGTGTSQSWYRVSDGLLVRRMVVSSNRSPAPGGTATYSERYELRLRSLAAARPHH